LLPNSHPIKRIGFFIGVKMLITKKEPTFQSAIYISANLHTVQDVCAEFCKKNPSCVTIESVDFIYHGGAQSGYRVKFINYPRFPSDAESIKQKSESLALNLLIASNQLSCSVVHSDETVYMQLGDKE
jgi:hypothetical protein